jgi:hypothetical protein
MTTGGSSEARTKDRRSRSTRVWRLSSSPTKSRSSFRPAHRRSPVTYLRLRRVHRTKPREPISSLLDPNENPSRSLAWNSRDSNATVSRLRSWRHNLARHFTQLSAVVRSRATASLGAPSEAEGTRFSTRRTLGLQRSRKRHRGSARGAGRRSGMSCGGYGAAGPVMM